MSINKRLVIFNSVMMIISMLLVFFVSNSVLDRTLRNSAKNYLKTSVYSAGNLFDARLDEMENCALLAIDFDQVGCIYESGNKEELDKCLDHIKSGYEYLDLGMFVDVSGNGIVHFSSNSDNVYQAIKPYLKNSPEESIKTQCIMDVNDVFTKKSGYADQYKIKLESTGELNPDCLMNIVISPVKDSAQDILGYMMLGEIINNSMFYPAKYSKIVPNSYLTVSLGNTRICSNIYSEDKSDYTGTMIPDVTEGTVPEDGMYFGSEYAPIGDNYFFLYKPIRGYFNEFQGYLSVGIPEHTFTEMLAINTKIIVSVVSVALVIILIASIYIGRKISNPILASADIARRISEGDFLAAQEYKDLKDLTCETEELLTAINEMADTLCKNQMRIEKYIAELKKEKEESALLSQQLLEMNSSLETKVDTRTLELRQTIEALKESNMVKTRFLANISHELKTPLTGNINASEILMDEFFGPLNDKQVKYVKNIWTSSNQLLLLINDILDISKIDAGKTNVNIGIYNVKEIFDEAICVVKSMAYKKSIKIQLFVFPENLTVQADKTLLKQILYNLMSNAIKFSHQNSSVQLQAERCRSIDDGREYVKISVSDTGIGIAEEDLERVFLEFEQADNSYSREYGGTGLGLPLSKKQIELQGGKIELHSKLNSGTNVVFYLPAGEEIISRI